MRTWYGVSGRQSAKSGYRKYEAEGGLESISLGAVWSYPLSKSWTLTAAAEAPPVRRRQDSPIVKERNQYSVGTMVTYTY